MSKELPKGWVEITISEYAITSESKGDEGRIPYLEIGDIDIMSKNYKLKDKPSVKGCKTTNKNDILISRVRPTRGAITVVKNDDTFVSSAFTILRFSEEVESKTIFYQLAYNKDFLNYLGENCTGTMYPTVSEQIIKDYMLKLPPLNEQKRIVAKLDAIMPRIEAVKARLDKVPTILKRFRQSVLTAAVTGKLTERWRQEHPEVESAEVLLERIRQEREERYKKECEEAKKKGKRIPKNNLPRFTSEISEVDCLWINIEIQQIFDVETGATPLKSNNAYYEAGTIPWVKSGDVKNCDIFECEEMITEKALKETNVKYYPVNSLLIAMYGEGKTRGQIGKLKFEATSNQACAALINPSLDEAIINYAYLFGRSQYEHLRMQAAGGNQPNLNLAKIKEWIIPLPPLDEQKEIVRQVDKLFALADKVEAHYQKAKARVDKLSQSVLAKAFRGELVPQDPNDEPAEKLLERILKEKERLSQGTQRTRGKKK